MTRPGFAIVGMACRYPDADNPSELWENVLAQRRAFRRMPAQRLNLDDYLSPDRDAADKTYCAQAAVLHGWEFDRNRFRIAGATFRSADMAHWLALEVAADALADAGFPDARGLPKVSTGVLVGNSLTGEFSRANLMRLRWPYVARVLDQALQKRAWSSDDRGQFLGELEQTYKSAFPPVGDETLAGGLSNTIAGRICNHFDLHGGGYTVDGACASSLLSVANSCASLACEDADVMLAGGVDLSLDPFELIGFAQVGALAPKQMRIFDARSEGFWPGEGCGFVVLMREQDAISQRRKIYGVIRGWGISSDGSGGITRPETEGQQLCLQRAYRRAGYAADTVGYFEGHGTGTTVGDETELQTISRARGASRASDSPPAVVGSIKANIGHTKAAAGVAGLIKATMAIDRQLIPPTTGWETRSPVIDQEGNVVTLLHESRTWNADAPMRVGVSGMGFGGINAHLTVEGQAKQRRRTLRRDEQRLTSSMQDCELLLFAADTRSELKAKIEQIFAFAAQISQAELGDLAAEMSRRLPSGAIRAAITAVNPQQLESATRSLLQWLDESERQPELPIAVRWDRDAGIALADNVEPPRIGFLFPGQGLLPNVDGGIWRRRLESVEQVFENLTLPADAERVDTKFAQPAIVTAELAGLHVLDDFGIQADLAIGHSLGELSAYHWAGACDADTLISLATARGNVIAEHGKEHGTMAGINASVETVNSLIAGTDVVIAAINAPLQTVVSGAENAVDRVIQRAKDQGVAATLLSVSHAFHSPLMAAAQEVFEQLLDETSLTELSEKVCSTISGELLQKDTDVRQLLLQQLTSPVRFVDAIRAAGPVDLWIEVGPGRVLAGLAGNSTAAPIVSVEAGGDSLRGLLETIAVAFAMGVNVRHQNLLTDRFTRPFDLNWEPKFLANPCETAPASSTPIKTADPLVGTDQPDTVIPAASETQLPLDCVRDLAAERAELPLECVKPGDRLLNELHLSSIAVGQVVADATRRLGLSPPAQPTYAANATVQDIADYLQQQLDQGLTRKPIEGEHSPAGVDHWTREFIIRLEQRQRPTDGAGRPGQWNVIGNDKDPLIQPLQQAFADAEIGSGVLVCLPQQMGVDEFDRMLEAARLATRSGDDARFVLVQRHCELRSDTGGAPFVRCFHLEYPAFITRVVTIPTEAITREAIDWIVSEAGGNRRHCEAYYDTSGNRFEPVWTALPDQPQGDVPLDPDDVLLVTGGGKGIAAECALALARETGVRLALLGRSRSADDEALRRNLLRMETSGVTLLYVPADVTDPDSISQAVEQVQAKLGPITGVLHAAGTNQPQSIATLSAEAFSRTLSPKVEGLRNVLRAIDPEQLRLLVTFGSIIARVGLRGQADYAVANEWLAQTTEQWGREHPHCHALCLEWSVWAGVGMGEKLGVVESLQRDGISALSVDDGIHQLKQAISSRGADSRVVIASRFGSPATIQFATQELSLLRFLERPRVHTPGVELVVDVTISMQSDPYLADHVYQGVPLLPAVMGLEAMAQVATALIDPTVNDPDLPADPATLVFEQVELLHPVVVPEKGEVGIRIAALVRDDDEVELALRCEETGFQQDHFRAAFKIDRATSTIASLHQPRETAEPLSINPEKLYGGILFHQGRFQRVTRYDELHGNECVAEIDTYVGDDWYSPYVPQRMILGDPASRDAIIHSIQACIPHGTLLPIAVERITIGHRIATNDRDASKTRVHAKERFHDGNEFVYDVDVLHPNGMVTEQWQGLRLRKVSQSDPSSDWPWQLLVPYFEQYLTERFGRQQISIAMRAGDAANRDSDEAIRIAAGIRVVPYRRGDGKPEIPDGRSVSATHCGELTMAIVSERQVACDIELVNGKNSTQWKDLLGRERFELSQLIARERSEPLQTAATRVWCAAECLTKSGLTAHESLTLDETTHGGWVIMRSGKRQIATWVWLADAARSDLVFAILVSPSKPVMTCDLLNTNT